MSDWKRDAPTPPTGWRWADETPADSEMPGLPGAVLVADDGRWLQGATPAMALEMHANCAAYEQRNGMWPTAYWHNNGEPFYTPTENR